MKIESKKQTMYLVLTLVVAAVGVLLITPELITANKPIETNIDFSATNAEDIVIMKKGETKVIPFDIIAPPEKALSLKVGVVEVGEELLFQVTGEQKLPEGISASVSRGLIQIPTRAGDTPVVDGLAKRDDVLVTITTYPTVKAGTYTLGLVLYNELNSEEGSGSTHYFRIQIPE